MTVLLAICFFFIVFTAGEVAYSQTKLGSPKEVSLQAGRGVGKKIYLLTMGPGESLYSRFGHAAFSVHSPGKKATVYNFGYTNFNDTDLVFKFLRGEAIFWVTRDTYSQTIADYRRQDRDIFRQRLLLDTKQVQKLHQLLEQQSRSKKESAYRYHHFKDNCATRLRDLIDQVTEGKLSRAIKGQEATKDSFRDLVRRGFAGETGLLVLLDLIVGRVVDESVDLWRASFLPRYLKHAVQVAGIAGKSEQLYKRKRRQLGRLDPLAGEKIIWGITAGVVLLGSLIILLARAKSRWVGFPVLLLSLILGCIAVGIWGLAIYATLPDLRLNELVLMLWPTDLFLLWVAIRWLRGRHVAGRLVRGYVWARLIVVVLISLGHLVGVLQQRPLVWLVLSSSYVGSLWIGLRFVASKHSSK